MGRVPAARLVSNTATGVGLSVLGLAGGVMFLLLSAALAWLHLHRWLLPLDGLWLGIGLLLSLHVLAGVLRALWGLW